MNTRLGINPLTWSNDDLPRLGSDISLDTCLREAAEVGYQGVELGHKFPRDAAVLGPLLSPHGLALVSGWYSLRLLERDAAAEFEAMQPHLALLSALGTDVMVCAEVTGCTHSDARAPLSARPVIAPGDWARFNRRMGELARMMRDAGMRLAYHHHMGTVVQSADDVDRLMAGCDDDVELLLDTGHLTFAGGDPVRAANDYAARVAHVHCKDIRPGVLSGVLNEDASFLAGVVRGVFTVPGDGCVDYPAVFAPLRGAGYEGWLVVEAEQDPTVADPLTFARAGREYLSSLAW
ncbi:myo-inosose-2 dehydratase [Marinihelvus fidelis]|uniref:Myo-inosose-2 dehydratase n=1 Tax=Marinihelvus fidelis TaxID=2613842 RepID=A0A5N0TA22_9GAMM|nr:myo-inosose-2 dehydratase [Marinihelvus fidelis]KAA9131621.1 myo-inosose-2 dehydratase [Marinihelvus fidelis]